MDALRRYTRHLPFYFVLAWMYSPSASASGWEVHTKVDPYPRAIVQTPSGAVLGFSWAPNAEEGRLFSVSKGARTRRSESVREEPYLYEHWATSRMDLICLPHQAKQKTIVKCYGDDLARTDEFVLFGNHDAGTIHQGATGTLWTMTSGEGRLLLNSYNRPGTGAPWKRTSTSSIACGGQTNLSCTRARIAAIAGDVLVILPLWGTFDGYRFVYGDVILWRRSGAEIGRVPIPSMDLDASSAKALAGFRGKETRLIFTAAVSREGSIALNPVLPPADVSELRRDEIWLHEQSRQGWLRLKAPGEVTALGFVDGGLAVGTADGTLWVYKD